MSDEFNAEGLDKAKWWDYAPHFPGRPGVYRTLARNVAQYGGDLRLAVDKVPDDQNWMGTDPTERAFFRDFRDVNHQNDLGIG